MRSRRLWVISFVVAFIGATLCASCGGHRKATQPTVKAPKPRRKDLPPRTPPPTCVHGALVTPQRVCGLGIAGRAMFWDDEKMRALARRRAARNLAGMLRTIVSSAMQVDESDDGSAIRWERYLEVDEALIDQIEANADHEIWFDVRGEGPFRDPERTYNCACLSASEAGIRVDTTQAAQQAVARQYSVDEVPVWLSNPQQRNRALHCAVGFSDRMYHPEEMYEPLAESVRVQLMGETRSWILSEFNQETLCGQRSGAECVSMVDSVVEAANEGVSRGVVLTAVWLDSNGLGPHELPRAAYGWGCVFDRIVLDRARERIAALNEALRAPVASDLPPSAPDGPAASPQASAGPTAISDSSVDASTTSAGDASGLSAAPAPLDTPAADGDSDVPSSAEPVEPTAPDPSAPPPVDPAPADPPPVEDGPMEPPPLTEDSAAPSENR